jgi:hypothetical protein
MYEIDLDGKRFGVFSSVVEAERWLGSRGWKSDDSIKWRHERPGRATLFVTIRPRRIASSLWDLDKMMRE